MLGQDITHHSSIGLPFFLSFAHMVFPEVFIWPEDWQFGPFSGSIRTTTGKNIMWETVKYTRARRNKAGFVFDYLWPNRSTRNECPSLEFEQLGAICGSAFAIDDQWINLRIFLTKSLPFDDSLLNSLLVRLRRPIQKEALGDRADCTYTRDLFDSCLSNERG
jgi:hypothetical protein